MQERLTVYVEAGPNQGAREWAARLLATRCGFPFRIAPVGAGERPSAAPALYYGRETDIPAVTVRPSGYFDGRIDSPAAVSREGAGELDGLPVPFGGRGIERGEGATAVRADVFAASFYLANRIEEISAGQFDEHGRFPAAASFMAANGVLDKPLIDLWAEWLAREIARLYPDLKRERRWGEGDFAVCVTHDIETLTPVRRAKYFAWRLFAAAASAARGRLGAAGRSLYAGASRAVTGRAPSWSFEKLRAAERPSPGTYFFFGGATSPRDGGYDVEAGAVAAVMRALRDEGCELGAHLGYETNCDADSMVRQKSKVARAAGRGVSGARHHYLCARFPQCWTAHEEAGFEYDATLAFAEQAGFRGATALPYRPFSPAEGRALDVLEVPLVAMDGSFFQYMGMSAGETVERVTSLARTVAEVGGVFTLLWHNTMVDPLDKPEESRAYFEITAALREMRGWWATLGGCAARWKEYAASLEA